MSRQRNNKVQLKAKCLTKSSLKQITPITPNQVKTFEAFQRNKHLMLHGCAAQAKTFIMIYLAMKAVLSRRVEQSKVVIVRSMLPTRDIEASYLLSRRKDVSLYRTLLLSIR